MKQSKEAAYFAEDGYVECKGFLPSGFVEIIKHYMMIKYNTGAMEIADDPIFIGDSVIKCYGDEFADAMLASFIPYVESVVGKSIVPTYSYMRIYKEGHKLSLHCDRPSCQYSTTLHIGVEPIEEYKDYKWPIYIEGNKVEQAPGDMVIYKGCEVRHKRDTLPYGNHFQLHFHYVDREMPWSEDLLFDARPGLGHPWKSRYKDITGKWSRIITKVRNEAAGEENGQGTIKVDNLIQLMIDEANNDRSS